MSLKYLLVGDVHERHNAPESRTDNFKETLKEKVSEIVQIAYEENVDAILQTGDLHDTPMPSLSTVIEYLTIWLNGIDITENLQRAYETHNALANTKETLERLKSILDDRSSSSIEEREQYVSDSLNQLLASEEFTQLKLSDKINNLIPIFVVGGNHDLYGNNIATLNRTMLGFLVNLGLIHLLDRDRPVIFERDGLDVAITGTHYHNDIDKKGFERDYIIEEKMAKKHIHIIHGNLVDKPMGNIIRHTSVDDIATTNADLTYAGHNHIGFDLLSIDGKYFLNSGAIPRLTADVKEIERMPKVYLIEVTQDDIIFTKIYLNAKKGEEVLSRKRIDDDKHKEEKFAEYRKMVRSAGKITGYNAIEVINSIADNKSFSKNVRDEAIKRVSLAMQSLGRGDSDGKS